MPIEKRSKGIQTPSSGSCDDNAVVRWDGTSCNKIDNSLVQIDDTGNIFPKNDGSQDLGKSGTNDWKDLFLSGNATIAGDLTVSGTTTTVDTTILEIKDPNVVLNNGGNDATSEGSGLTVERTGTDGSLVYEDALTSKWKCGALGSEAEILNKNNDTDDLQEGATNLYFTDERAQDAVGGILTDTASVDFTYDDGSDTISAVVLAAGVDHGGLGGLADDDHTQYFQVIGRGSENLTISGADLRWSGTGNIGKSDLTERPEKVFVEKIVDINSANIGSCNDIQIRNSDATNTNSDAALFLQCVNGGGEPYVRWLIEDTPTRIFSMGLDNSDNILKISNATGPDNGDTLLSISSTGIYLVGGTDADFKWAVDETGDIGAPGANRPGNANIGTAVIIDSADLNSGNVKIGGSQVLAKRQIGWAAPTGTNDRTTFDTSTVTLPELAERVKSLIDDLTTHGIIGT